MKILVTGGAGFIGSHVADRFIREGHEVHVIDNLTSGMRENVPEDAVFHELDITSADTTRLVENERYEAIAHLAAQIDVRKSVADPAFDAEVNVVGFLRLMEAARRSGLRKVIFSSTGGAIYGEPEWVPQDESHRLAPLSPYGLSKLTAEQFLSFYQRTYQIDTVALRYANVYGPRQQSHGEAGVIAIFAGLLLDQRSPKIYGDGEQTRDYVYVEDVVEANYLALDFNGSGTFNVGTGVETSVNTLFGHLRRQIAPHIDAVYEPPRAGEQLRSVLSFRKAASELGWRPRVSLPVGLKSTVEWFKSRTEHAP